MTRKIWAMSGLLAGAVALVLTEVMLLSTPHV